MEREEIGKITRLLVSGMVAYAYTSPSKARPHYSGRRDAIDATLDKRPLRQRMLHPDTLDLPCCVRQSFGGCVSLLPVSCARRDADCRTPA